MAPNPSEQPGCGALGWLTLIGAVFLFLTAYSGTLGPIHVMAFLIVLAGVGFAKLVIEYARRDKRPYTPKPKAQPRKARLPSEGEVRRAQFDAVRDRYHQEVTEIRRSGLPGEDQEAAIDTARRLMEGRIEDLLQ
jgi:hypothetical protein